MKLSTKGRYGTRALVELAVAFGNGPMLIKKIAQNQDISEKYLERIFALLKHSGMIKSIRGAKGGYSLARDPGKIRLLEVINALEGSLALTECAEDKGTCDKSNWCVTRKVWVQIQHNMEDTLKSVTLKDLALDYSKRRGVKAKMYYI